jgi:hypothetical protein
MYKKEGQGLYGCPVDKIIMCDENDGDDPEGSREVEGMGLDSPVMIQVKDCNENDQKTQNDRHGGLNWFER